jgi:PAS domain S-box-containing protein
MARMFGYTVEEIVDRLDPLELVYPEDRPRVVENLRRRLEGEVEEMRYEFRLLRKDGSVFFVEAHGSRIEHGGKGGVIGTLVDVTERKRAEAERQAHVRFLESLDRVSQAMQSTNDLEPMMSNVLEAVRSIFGCDRAWLVYPCEPQAPAWRAVMEQTGPGYPGAFALGSPSRLRGPLGVALPPEPGEPKRPAGAAHPGGPRPDEPQAALCAR